MPLEIPDVLAAVQFWLVAIIADDKYYLIGYSGTFKVSDLAYDVMNLANGHMVALPGASRSCFFIGTTVAWIYYELFNLYITSCSS